MLRIISISKIKHYITKSNPFLNTQEWDLHLWGNRLVGGMGAALLLQLTAVMNNGNNYNGLIPTANAQTNACYVANLRTIQTKVNGEWGKPPVLLLQSNNYMEISFDDLQHNYVRYTYAITHCDATWEPSDLYEGDYMTGMNNAYRIDNYTQSMNTEMMYNHYTLRIPNNDVKLLVSGNYKVDIYEDGDDDPVATACFSIVDPKVGIDISVSPNTDIDSYQSHQQVDFNINYQTYECTNPEAEFKPVVVQNRRWDNHVSDILPTYLRTNQLVYIHNQKLIFDAGNEYRRFEILDRYVPTMRIERMAYQPPYYHAYLFGDKPRTNYKYDQDQDGRYYVRNGDNYENDSESDYFYTHFTLNMPEITGGDVYIHGDLTYGLFTDDNKMEYNMIDHQYEKTLLLKQGSYNYLYLFIPNGSEEATGNMTEGDFHQTENEYYIYVYHRPFGGRYDKLVAFKALTYKPQ